MQFRLLRNAVTRRACAHSAVALPDPAFVVVGVAGVEVVVVGVAGVEVGVVDLLEEPPRRFPSMLPAVDVTPDRSPWALAPPMPASIQATITRRCILGADLA